MWVVLPGRVLTSSPLPPMLRASLCLCGFCWSLLVLCRLDGPTSVRRCFPVSASGRGRAPRWMKSQRTQRPPGGFHPWRNRCLFEQTELRRAKMFFLPWFLHPGVIIHLLLTLTWKTDRASKFRLQIIKKNMNSVLDSKMCEKSSVIIW